MSTQPVTLDFSKAQSLEQSGVTLDFSKAQPLPGQQPEPQIQPITRMTNPKLNIAASGENMPEYVGATGAAGGGLMALAAAGAVPGAPAASAALMPIAKRYGIKALEGGGLAAGYDLYRHLKKVFEGE